MLHYSSINLDFRDFVRLLSFALEACASLALVLSLGNTGLKRQKLLLFWEFT
jgi:hypothetical protein